MILLLAFLTLLAGLGSTETDNRLFPTVHYVEENKREKECTSKTCINKCCSQKEYLLCDKYTVTCECQITNVTNDFSSFQLYSDQVYDEKVDTKLTEVFAVLQSFYTNLSNESRYHSIASSKLPQTRVFVGVDGKARLETPNAYQRWTIYGTDEYCVDLINDTHLQYDIVLVIKETLEPDSKLYKYTMLVSSFFLILVLIVYAVLPELRNLPGKMLMAYVFSQSMAFLTFATLQFLTSVSVLLCETLVAIIYFWFLSSFCWMNVLCYDIFWTFRTIAKKRQHKHGVNFKFAIYCLYAWGVPLAMTVMMIMMDKADFSDKPWIIQPLLIQRGCFFTGGQKLVYLYAPMLILIICNWLLFVLTVFNIWRDNRSTAMARSPAAGNKKGAADRNRFLVYIKLSVVMGVNWLLEVISSLYPNLDVLSIINMYNILVGLILFILFVCNKKIYNLLLKKFTGAGAVLNRESTTNTSRDSGHDIALSVSEHPRGSRRDRNF